MKTLQVVEFEGNGIEIHIDNREVEELKEGDLIRFSDQVGVDISVDNYAEAIGVENGDIIQFSDKEFPGSTCLKKTEQTCIDYSEIGILTYLDEEVSKEIYLCKKKLKQFFNDTIPETIYWKKQ